MNTPLTDAQVYQTYSEGGYGGELAVDPDFARKLERDRARLFLFVDNFAKYSGSDSDRIWAREILAQLEADK